MKDNINKNLSLAEFDVRTVSNGPSVFFFRSDLWLRREAKNTIGKTRFRNLQ